jgi:hypothetical protein
LLFAREDNQQHLLRTRDETTVKLFYKNFIDVSGLAVSVGKGCVGRCVEFEMMGC